MQSTKVTGGASALLDTLRAFWPGAEVALTNSPSESTRYAVVPSARRPRSAVPVAGRSVSAAPLRRFSAALTLRDVAMRSAAAAVVRVAGVRAVTHDFISVSGGTASLQDHLSARFEKPVTFSVGVGPSRANQKPILQVLDLRGHTVGFVKVGDSPVARRHVAGEAAALAMIGDALDGSRISTPKLLFTEEWHGMLLLAMTALPSQPQRPSGFWRTPLAAMAEFSARMGLEQAPLAKTPQWERLLRDLARLDEPMAKTLSKSCDRILEYAGEHDMVISAWHGDWTPWNMARARHQLYLWDFERCEKGVVYGLDAFHYAINAATLRRGETVDSVLEGIHTTLRAVGDTPRHRLTAAIYLLAISVRYLGSYTQQGGHLIARRLSIVLESLGRWLPEVQPLVTAEDPGQAVDVS